MRRLDFTILIVTGAILALSVSFLMPLREAKAAEAGQVWGSCETGTLGKDFRTYNFAGYKFTPLVNGRITKVCGYFKGSAPIAIYDSSCGWLGAEGTINNSSYQWSCVSVTPLDVQANTTYYVLAEFYCGNGSNWPNIWQAYRYRDSPALLPSTCNNVRIESGVASRTGGSICVSSDHNTSIYAVYGMVDFVFTATQPPQISVSPSSFYFGSIPIGSSGDSVPPVFTVRNTGGGILSGSVSDLAAPFSCVSGCFYNLSAGQQQTTILRFAPTSVGSFSDTAIFSGGGGANVNVSGDSSGCIPANTTGNYTINANCIIKSGSTEGTEGGNLTIATSTTVTMQGNTFLVFNQGRSIFVNGIIAKPLHTAIIKKGNLGSVTLSVTLSASPSSGTAPLNGVDLTATVSGTATGDIRYQFDCTNDSAYESDNTVSTNPYTKTDLCNYSSAGTYAAKVRATRQSIIAENTTTITVSTACPCLSGVCCDGCNYRSSSYICSTWIETEYGCPWGSSCGNDVGVHTRTDTQYCSGSSSNCSGSISYGSWSSWSTQDDCTSTETCSPGSSSCSYNASCCTPATCSSLGKNCGNWSDGCGGTLNCGNCSDQPTTCDYGTCNANQRPSWSCNSNGQCVYGCYNDSSCVPNPAAAIQDCGVNPGDPIGGGQTARTGDLLVKNVDGYVWCSCNNLRFAFYCKAGTNCSIVECVHNFVVVTEADGTFSCFGGSGICEFCIVDKAHVGNPIIVNSVPSCSFSTGDRGDIFARNESCSWSDYKCSITGTHDCGYYDGVCSYYRIYTSLNQAILLPPPGGVCVRR